MSDPEGAAAMDRRRVQLLEERRKIEERTLMSSVRSVSLLKESEDIGNATAVELTVQREQLQNTEQKLDDINSSLRTSEKHIQSLKSVFGSIKNYFSKSGSHQVSARGTEGKDQVPSVPKSRSELSKVLEETRRREAMRSNPINHPVLQRFRDDPQPDHVDSLLDQNLGEMANSLARLKNLGLGLQDELEDQNFLVERIGRKTEDVDFRMSQQSKEMNRILKK